ncbi:MAG TPA: glycosyltransferase 87 family protein [Candidatus Eisenbacteria bacterium]|nr:glycosyltransferase 87 family protein [Candidatus Eisenbacteria bacterium]
MTSERRLQLCGLLVLAALAPIPFLGDLRVRTGAMIALWGAAHLAYLAAAWIVIRGTRISLPAVALVAALLRALFLPTEPTLSEDVYRYLWDGRLVTLGVNPYVLAPDDPALAAHRDPLLERLNHAHVPTIYPPAAQLLFASVAAVSTDPRAFKAALLVAEAALVAALLSILRARGLPAERLLVYAWNPLVVVESYGSGHLDLVLAALLVTSLALLERGRRVPAGIAWALAVTTKYTPLLLAPWVARRKGWAFLAAGLVAIALLYLPFASAGGALGAGLATYARHWEFNGSLHPALEALTGSGARARWILAGALGVATLWTSWRARSGTAAALAILTATIAVSPTVYPWYLVPLIALLPLHPSPAILAFSGLVALSYAPLPRYHAFGEWTLPAWIPWVEYGGTVLVAIAAAVWAARRGAAQERRIAWARESVPT